MYHNITRRTALKGGVATVAATLAAPSILRVMLFIWMSVIVGGAGNNWGLLAGAGIVMTILEGTRFLGDFIEFLDAEKLSAIRIIMIGALLIIILRVRPRGLLPEPRFTYKGSRTDALPATGANSA